MGSTALKNGGRLHKATALMLALTVILSMSGIAVADMSPEGLEITSIERISVDSTGAQTTSGSETAWISDSGRYVLFWSRGQLVPEDTNGVKDCYRKDMTTGAIVLVSVSDDEEIGNGDSFPWGITGDGNKVVFISSADALVDGDTNFRSDAFVRDISAGTTVIASLSSAGAGASWGASSASISDDGRYVAFNSTSDDLVAGDTVATQDTFVRDLQLGTTVCASVTTTGTPGTGTADYVSISGDGQHVAFASTVDLVNDGAGAGVYVRDMGTGTTERITHTTDGLTLSAPAYYATISADARFVTFHTAANNVVEGDEGGEKDVFLYDRQDDVMELISVSTYDGQGDGESRWASVSDDGRYVAYYSHSTNLVDGDTNEQADVFIRDRAAGRTVRASVTATGTESSGTSLMEYGGTSGGSETPNISGDGTRVAFESGATNLVSGDTNNQYDIFAADVEWVLDEVSVEGSTRFSTGVAISQAAFPESSTVDTVLITTGRNWPDALGGSALAGALGAPILLVDTNSIPTEVADEIRRLDPSRAVILGGTAAVGSGVYETLVDDLEIPTVDRIAGASRYETGRAIAQEAVLELGPGYDGTAIVTTGLSFPDALAASPISAAMGWPIFTVGATLDSVTLSTMQDAGVTDVVILGGVNAVSDDVATDLEAEFGLFHVSRLDGQSRYDTARVIAEFGVNECGLRWDGVALATGMSFPDALAGGVLQARMDSVLLLTPATGLDAAPREALTENADVIHEIRFLGGLSALSQTVRDQATAIVE